MSKITSLKYAIFWVSVRYPIVLRDKSGDIKPKKGASQVFANSEQRRKTIWRNLPFQKLAKSYGAPAIKCNTGRGCYIR